MTILSLSLPPNRSLAWALAALLSGIGIGGGAAALALTVFATAAQAAPAAYLSRDAELADLHEVREAYIPKERAYTPQTRAQAEALLAKGEERAGRLSRADLLVLLAQVAALADNGHSNAHYHDPQAIPPARLPLAFTWFQDGLLITRAYGEYADLAGAQVLAVDGHGLYELYARARRLWGGTEPNRRANLTDLIPFEGVLHSLGVADSPDRLRLSLRLKDGRRVERTVAMKPLASMPEAAEFEHLWWPELTPDETKAAGPVGWKPALTDPGLPLYVQDGNHFFRTAPLPGLDALYAQFRTNESDGGQDIKAFQAETEKLIAARRPHDLVLDLRFDTGGNLNTTLDFMRRLPTLVPGRIFLMTGPYTFSAGIVSAAAVKLAGKDKVTIVGEEVGDRLRFWSEGGLVRLPNSHFSMRYTDGMFDMAKGCGRPPEGCFGGQFDVDVGSLKPDITAPLTLKAYISKRDPGLEAIYKALGRRAPAA